MKRATGTNALAAVGLLLACCGRPTTPTSRADELPPPSRRAPSEHVCVGEVPLIRAALERLFGAEPVAALKKLDTIDRANGVYTLLYATGPTKAATLSQEGYDAAMRGSATSANGWYYFTGARDPRSDLVRVYLNVMPDGAPSIARCMSEGLARSGLAYEFKLPSLVSRFGRASTAVLYVERSESTAARAVVAQCVAADPDAIGQETPWFTKRVGPGVAVADEPLSAPAPPTRPQHSHATLRSDAIAEAIADAPDDASVEDLARLACLRFVRYGVDPRRPWLRQHKADDDL